MSDRRRRHADKSGMPPGTLTYIGPAAREPATLTRIEYSTDHIREDRLDPSDVSSSSLPDNSSVLLVAEGIHDLETIRAVGRAYGLHPLVLEDVVNTEQRAKVDNYGGYAFAVLRRLTLAPPAAAAGSRRRSLAVPTGSAEIERRQYSIVLIGNAVILFTEAGPDPVVRSIRERLRHPASDIRGGTTDYLFYAIVDTIADSYFSLADTITSQVDELEDAVGPESGPEILQRISNTRRSVIFFRRYLTYALDTVGSIASGKVPEVAANSHVFFVDVRDHVRHVLESAETQREILSGLLELHLSYQNHRLSEIMKVLTVIATIFIPLTFVAGIYGMNFAHRPELTWRWGYPVILGVMAAIASWLLIYFKRRRWF
ncbi:MAG: magnesium and cobalt transport protein CorA [bacterium]